MIAANGRTGIPLPPRVPFTARGGMVAAAHPFVAEAAIEILRDGGNAIDAAIAAAAVMMSTDPCNSHLGGDGFCVVHRADGSVHAFNGSGAAPTGATLDYYRALGGFPKHGMAIATVPGVVDLWSQLHRRFGTKSLRDVLARGIAYARSGVPVSPRVHEVMQKDSKLWEPYPASRAVFMPNGRVPNAGEVLAQPKLARALERVAEGGADEFYRGKLAAEMLAFSSENGGQFTSDDLARHATGYGPALKATYRGNSVFELPPVSQGIALLLCLSIVDRFDLHRYEPQDVERFHIMIEAVKLAFEDMATLGDPNFNDNRIEYLLSKEHADEQAARIDLRRAKHAKPLGTVAAGTENAVFADAEGNVVSYIQSTFHSCGLVMGETGVLWNGRLPGFSLDPASPNVVAPRKRPMHTLTNYVMHDRNGNVILAGGTPGGNFQPQVNMQVLSGILDHGMSLTDAIAEPRFTVGIPRDIKEAVVRIEDRVPQSLLDGLTALGHRVETIGPWEQSGAVQLVARDPQSKLYSGATEIRRSDSVVLGL